MTPSNAPYKLIQKEFKARAKAAIKGKLFWDSARMGTYINPLKAKAKRNDSK